MMEIENLPTQEKKKTSKLAWFVANMVGALVGVFLCIFVQNFYWVDIKSEGDFFWWVAPFGLSVINNSWRHLFLRYLLSIILGVLVGLCLSLSQRIVLKKRMPFNNSLFIATILGAIIASIVTTTNKITGGFQIDVFHQIPILALFSFVGFNVGINPLTLAISTGILQYLFSRSNIIETKPLIVTGTLGIVIGMIIPAMIYLALIMPFFCIGPEC